MSKIPDKKECAKLLEKAGCSEDVIAHCGAVHRLAMKIAKLCNADLKLVSAGALLHDIGRSRTHGIRHAVEGAKIARKLGLPKAIVLIIERHIGAGLTRDEAVELGLPPKDYMPLSLEEKIVAHADNLIATREKQSVTELAEKLDKKGLNDGAKRTIALHRELSELCGMELDKLDL